MDRSERAKFVVRGGEAVDFLQGQVSNDVESLAPGTGCYATILNHKGKLRTDLRILRGEDFLWIDTEAVGHAVLRHMLATYTLGRDVQWEDLTEDHAILSAHRARRGRAGRRGAPGHRALVHRLGRRALGAHRSRP